MYIYTYIYIYIYMYTQSFPCMGDGGVHPSAKNSLILLQFPIYDPIKTSFLAAVSPLPFLF